jgi:F-type H+-transporting ATPase subunit epsilon
MEKLRLEVVTPARVVASGEVDTVTAPGSWGEFGVLPGHAAFITGIVPGELRYAFGSEKECIAVTRGFAEVFQNRVSVLVEAAEKASDIDVERARRAMERARERLAGDRKTQEINYQRAEAALQRAVVRIKVAEKSK